MQSGGAKPTVSLLEEQWGTAALQPAVGHERDAIAQRVSLLHVVSGQQDRLAPAQVLQQRPDRATCLWVHARCRLV